MDRLVTSPVFVLSSARSGSTLLRSLLDTHSQIFAPQLNISDLQVTLSTNWVELAMQRFELDNREIEHILWDRLLHGLLVDSGKRIIVEKNVRNSFIWERLAECWPKARFVFLLRHPANIAASWMEMATGAESLTGILDRMLSYIDGVEGARSALDGLTVRYEELTAYPEQQTQRLCDFLQVPWERDMLDYGRVDRGPFVRGYGDWGDKIRSGQIQPGRPLPETHEVPAELQARCHTWGYLP
ncbi:MAG: sulfotransferase family protein [Streptomycetales bacterium]